MAHTDAAAVRRELGAELRSYREAAGLNRAQLAHDIGWTPTRISRIEAGKVGISEVDLILYLAFCGTHRRDQDLDVLFREAELMLGYWLSPHGPDLEDSLRSLIYHESTASASVGYAPHFIPGLLQTEGYARAVISQDDWRTAENVEFCVRARMARQHTLHRLTPAKFTFFLHEHALRWQCDAMPEQLLALTLLDGLPHIDIRVVPAGSMFGGAFRMLHYTQHKPLVHLDAYFAGLFLEAEEYVAPYRELVAVIAKAALGERESREFLTTLAGDHDRGSPRDDEVEESRR
ncbi:helix-turn-helix transcriptional regulator [Actinophytocola sp.]|uniref:helix-turn-helix domain-containing protein n=1 Tax=Actinophytocola sp. TaxID=1872138 RepID=UPI002D7FFA38|nr:helix-turn-helix transcriptional regulator [Actinophytocola sp.]HET9138797.1 helix-turn-helix transcriptional regulator [Actinophytocola sp.]